jgi:uncharacterized protein YbjT (DUF2867 family)
VTAVKVLLLGASGMVGQGVLRACLDDDRVDEVLAVVRSPLATADPKLEQVVLPDLAQLSTIADRLEGLDAALCCVGVSASGMAEDRYRLLTLDLTVSMARAVADVAPGSVFIYVTGAGTDDSGRSRMMWARVKGATENALRELPLRTFFFRPGFMQAVDGGTSKTPLYAVLYRVVGPVYPVARRLFPRQVTSTLEVGQAMLNVCVDGYPSQVLTTADINIAAKGEVA